MERHLERRPAEIARRGQEVSGAPSTVPGGALTSGFSSERPRRVCTIGLVGALQPEALRELTSWAKVKLLSMSDLAATGPQLRGVGALLTESDVPSAWLDRCCDLRSIVKVGGHFDPELLRAAQVRGIACRNVAGGREHSVAEYVMGALLQWERGFPRSCGTASGQARRFDPGASREIRGTRLGIIGFGRVGHRIAEIAQSGFRMQVLVHTRSPLKLPSSVCQLSLERLWTSSDYLVVCCSSDAFNRHLIGRRLLSKGNPDLLLVNVSSPSVIDEHALALALEEGRLRGAVLDDLQDSTTGGPLYLHPRVMHTRQIAERTRESECSAAQMAVRELLLLV